jgi:ATP-dependent Clp protease ATP-binding subunit ClpC
MNGYNFTERVRKVLAMAREESSRLHHEYVGTEHILLGLIREGEGVAAVALQNLNIDLDDVQQKIEDVVKKGKPGQTTGPDLPYTSRAKKVLELSMAEARDLNHAYVGTEHLLLGLLREEKGIAAQVLVGSGVTLDAARDGIVQILGETPQARPRVARAASIAAMKVWSESSGARTPATTSASAHMAASIIELLAQDSDVGAVFAAQGIDVAKLAEALRVLAKSSESAARAEAKPPATPPEPPAGDSPSPPAA